MSEANSATEMLPLALRSKLEGGGRRQEKRRTIISTKKEEKEGKKKTQKLTFQTPRVN
jgi:hypothetical protein